MKVFYSLLLWLAELDLAIARSPAATRPTSTPCRPTSTAGSTPS